MTTLEVLESRINKLEADLAEVKAELARLRVPSPPKTLGDLYGILAHAGDFSEEESDAMDRGSGDSNGPGADGLRLASTAVSGVYFPRWRRVPEAAGETDDDDH